MPASEQARAKTVSVGEPSQRCRIKARERVERLVSVPALRRHVEESCVEVRVVTHQYGAITLVRLDRLPHNRKQLPQRDVLGDRALRGSQGRYR